MTYNLVLAGPVQASSLWDQIEPLLQDIEKGTRGEWTVDQVINAVSKDEWHLALAWNVEKQSPDAVMGYRVRTLSNGEVVCTVGFLEGRNIKDWFGQLWTEFHNIMKQGGCTQMSIMGRKGLQHYFEKSGIRATRVVFDIEV